MSDDKTADKAETESSDETAAGANGDAKATGTNQSGPTFNQQPDPLAGVKKSASDVMDSMEGKTVSMKVYVGSIIAVIVLMLLARCGG